nr:LuxR C-terminal-related transcriptional regulator [Serratia proteamaculans]
MNRLTLTIHCPDGFYATGVRLALGEHLAARGISVQTAAEAAHHPYSTPLVLSVPGIAAPAAQSPALQDGQLDGRRALLLDPYESVASLLTRVDAHLQRFSFAKAYSSTRLSRLSPQEYRVLRLLARGFSSVAIARQLQLNAKTVSSHKRNAMKKLNITCNTELLHWLLNGGIK